MIRTIAKASILRGAGALISFTTTLCVAMLFDARGLGVYQLTLSVLLGIGIVFRYGLDFLAIKEVPVATAPESHLQNYLGSSLLLSIPLLLASLIIYYIFPLDLHGISIPFAYLAGLSISMLLILAAYQKARSQTLTAIFYESIMWQLILLVGIFILHYGGGTLSPKSLSLIFLGATATSFILAISTTPTHIKTHVPTPGILLKTLTNSSPLFLFSALTYINGSLGLYLAGIFFHSTGAGVFSLPQKLLMLFTMLSGVLNAIYFPKLSVSFRNLDKVGFLALIKEYYFYYAAISIPVVIVLFLTGDLLLTINKGFIIAPKILNILLTAQCLTIILGNFGPILLIIGRAKISLLGLIVSAASMTAFVALTKELGIISIAWGMVISTFTGGCIVLAGLIHTIRNHFNYQPTSPPKTDY